MAVTVAVLLAMPALAARKQAPPPRKFRGTRVESRPHRIDVCGAPMHTLVGHGSRDRIKIMARVPPVFEPLVTPPTTFFANR